MEYMIYYIAVFTFGITIGSFLNVCIFRIPDKNDIVSERSHCFSCGNVLKWYELIPVVSFVIQRGKCRHCSVRLSRQYPLVELANGLIYVWIVAVHEFAVTSLLYCLCASALLVISIIDWRTYEIPFGCNIFIGLLGIIRILTDPVRWPEYVLGFFTVSGLFLLIYWITRGRGIGGGDIKLMAAAGLLLGWQGILLAMVIGSVTGSVIHMALMKIKHKERVLAFGPYLSLGILAALLYGGPVINWYLGFYR